MRTPVAKSAYGRPSRSAIMREIGLDLPLELLVDDERAARDARDQLDRAVVVGRAEPSRDEAEVGLEALRESARSRSSGASPTIVIRSGSSPSRTRLGGEERPVPVLPVAADELAARDDDRRPRAASRGGRERSASR